VARRFGLENSKTRGILLDAADQLMREEGYAAVTSRRVASKAGLKPQLVHYYFRTMDDLFLALLQRGAEQNREYLARALASSHPLKAVWELSTNPEGTTLIGEFMALANHRKTIRAEIARHAEQFRAMQIEVLSGVFQESGVDLNVWPPAALVVFMESVARVLVLESSLGMSSGHAETIAFIEEHLRKLGDQRERSAAAKEKP
jgi:AcrR family transcriptional regulator